MAQEKDSFKVSMGNRIWKKRTFYHLSREKLAEIIDISPTFLYDIESGKKSCSYFTLQKICETLSVTADYLLFGREKYGDVSQIVDMLSNLDPQYLPLAEEHLKTLIKTVTLKETASSEEISE